MATIPSAGIAKDTSARKNAGGPTTHSAMEVRAIKASYEAYIKTITEEYADENENMKAAHTEEVATLKASHDKLVTQLRTEAERLRNNAKNEERLLIEDAKAEASKASVARISSLEATVVNLTREVNKAKEDNRDSTMKAQKLDVQIQKLKKTHVQELDEARSKKTPKDKTPSIVIYLRQGGSRFHTRCFTTKPTDKLSKHLELNFPQYPMSRLAFVYKGVEIKDLNKTISELGIKDRETIKPGFKEHLGKMLR